MLTADALYGPSVANSEVTNEIDPPSISYANPCTPPNAGMSATKSAAALENRRNLPSSENTGAPDSPLPLNEAIPFITGSAAFNDNKPSANKMDLSPSRMRVMTRTLRRGNQHVKRKGTPFSVP